MWKKNKGNIWSNSVEDESIYIDKKPKKENKSLIREEKVVEKVVIQEKVVYKKAPKFSHAKSQRRSAAFIITAILIAITCIVVPFALLFSLMAKLINEGNEVIDNMGYRVGTTKFSIKHEDSGKYITAPKTESENISLVDEKPTLDDKDDIYTIVYKTTDKETELWIQSEFYLGNDENGQQDFLTMEVNNGSPVWSSEYQEKGISLEKKKDEDLYGIKFESNEMYLAKDNKSDQLTLAWSPDWFEFHAYVKPITTTSEYYDDYIFLHQNDEEINLGVNGNPLSIRSTKSNLYLNSSGISFGPENIDSKETSFVATKDEEFNFFVPDTSDEVIMFASYATLNPIYYYDDEILETDFYPIMVPDGENLLLENINDAHKIPTLNVDEAISNDSAQVYLIYNPSNLRQKAIYFVEDEMFLNTNESGKIFLSKEREYFIFEHSDMQSPEDFYFSLVTSYTDTAIFSLFIENYKYVKNYKIQMYGVEESESSQYGISIVQEITKVVYPKSTMQNVKIKGLDSKYAYYGYIVLNREENSGLHKTIRLFSIPPEEIEEPTPATIDRLWDSSAENGAITLEDSDTNVQISMEFEQSTGFGIKKVKQVEVRIIDSEGRVAGRQEVKAKSGTLIFDFEGLTTKTDYIVEVYFDGELQEDKNDDPDHNNTINDNSISIETEIDREEIVIRDEIENVGGDFGSSGWYYTLHVYGLYEKDTIEIQYDNALEDPVIWETGTDWWQDEDIVLDNVDGIWNILYTNSTDIKDDAKEIEIAVTLKLFGYEEEWVAADLTTVRSTVWAN